VALPFRPHSEACEVLEAGTLLVLGRVLTDLVTSR
jgi:hypothetical protein